MTLETRLTEIKKRIEAATEGPWYECKEYDWVEDKQSNLMFEYVCKDSKKENMAFIAHARTDVPMLLEMVEVLRSYAMENKYPVVTKTLEQIVEKYNDR